MGISILSFLYSIFITISAFLVINGFLLCPSALSFSTREEDSSWHISALKVSYDNEKQVYVAEGEVIITGVSKGGSSGEEKLNPDKESNLKTDQDRTPQPSGETDLKAGTTTTQLKADYVEFSNITRDAVASGNVILISGRDSVTCERLQLNLETETGTIYNGTIFIEQNHFYIKGDAIEKSGRDTYRADRASVTSCDGENPDWKLSGRDIKVTIEGYGTAKSATLWAGTIPALYSPIVLFPAKTKRQTGLLTPSLSSSERKGFEVELPLYLNISRGADATLYTDYMSKRGMKMGLEYRYISSADNYGTLFYDYLYDDKIDDGTSASEDYSYDSTPTRGNHDRYWFRMKNSYIFDNTWNARLDIDYVSDADYLHEFKDGLTGFNTVSRYFKETFGRSLDEYDDTTRENSLNINRTWAGATINIGAQWFDNVVARQTDSEDNTLQTLPSVEFNRVRQQIGSTSLYYDIDSEYRYFYRDDTSEELLSGHRTDIFPRAYIPLKFGAFYLEPSAGVRQTMWYLPSSDDNTVETSESYTSADVTQLSHREMADFNLELSTKLSRVFNTGNSFAEKIKHEILPTIEYSYTPDISQNDLPYFDDLDYIEEENCVTWSLANRLTSRNKKRTAPSGKIKKSDKSQESYEPLFNYREFAWMEISQSYRVEPSEQDDSLKLESEDYLSSSWLKSEYALRSERSFKAGKSFSDISSEIEISPAPFVSLNNDLKWSPYDNRFTSHDSGITIRDTRGDALETWYRYEEADSDSESESLFAGLNTKLTDSINLFISCEHDLIDKKNIESHTGFYLNRPCWSMRVAYSETQDDQALSFIVNLHGLGEFGNK